jgi:type III pantothenate kinase
MKKGRNSLLALDIGNSTIGLGLFRNDTDHDSLLTGKLALTRTSFEGSLCKTISTMVDEACASLADRTGTVKGLSVIVSSVVPAFNPKVIRAVKKFCSEPFFIDHKSSGLNFRTPFPDKIGADRIANAVAGFSITHKPTAIMDFGTATTISVVGGKRTFMGGAIMPGMDIMAASLASGTAKLPCINIDRPECALGTDTASAITSGIVIGTAGAVMKIVSSIEKETGLRLRLIITGGRAGVISSFLERPHLVIPDLIFEGLRLIHVSAQDS